MRTYVRTAYAYVRVQRARRAVEGGILRDCHVTILSNKWVEVQVRMKRSWYVLGAVIVGCVLLLSRRVHYSFSPLVQYRGTRVGIPSETVFNVVYGHILIMYLLRSGSNRVP